MASAAVYSLCQLLLQQSDRHPIGTLDGVDLEAFDESLVRAFLADRLLVQSADLQSTGEEAFFRKGSDLITASIEEGEFLGGLDPRTIEIYEVGIDAICKRLRDDLGLRGPLPHSISPGLFFLGMASMGKRRREYYLACALRGQGALQPLLFIRGYAVPGNIVTVLTPTRRDLPSDVLRRVGDDRIGIVAVSELLDADASEPLTLTGADAGLPLQRTAVARLVLDRDGHTVTFDGGVPGFEPREFAVLAVLAVEAADGGGIVPRDVLLDAMRAAVGRGEAPNSEQLNIVISGIRKKLKLVSAGDEDGRSLVKTASKVGYRLNLPQDDIDLA